MKQIIKITPVDSVVKEKERLILVSVQAFQVKLESLKIEIEKAESYLFGKKQENSDIQTQINKTLDLKNKAQADLDSLLIDTRKKREEFNTSSSDIESNVALLQKIKNECKDTQEYWAKRIKELSFDHESKSLEHEKIMKSKKEEKSSLDLKITSANENIDRLTKQKESLEKSTAEIVLQMAKLEQDNRSLLNRHDEAAKSLDKKMEEIAAAHEGHMSIANAVEDKKKQLEQVSNDLESKNAQVIEIQRQKLAANEKDRMLARKESILKQTFKTIGLSISGPFLQSEENDPDKTEYESLQLQCGPDEEVRMQVSASEPGNPKYYIAKK